MSWIDTELRQHKELTKEDKELIDLGIEKDRAEELIQIEARLENEKRRME